MGEQDFLFGLRACLVASFTVERCELNDKKCFSIDHIF